MAERTVLRMGHPDLMVVADPVQAFGTPELDRLVQDLWDTMRAYGGIGLAATQIGEPWRIVVFGLDDADPSGGSNARNAVPRTVLINPVIQPTGEEMVGGWEACLSVPGMRGLVPRHESVRYRGYDFHGNLIDREVGGFHARVVQHEVDHLDGVLYPMRMEDMSTFGFDEELRLAEARAPVETASVVDCS